MAPDDDVRQGGEDRPPAAAGKDGPAGGRGAQQFAGSQPACCPLYHRAVELIGRRWTGAILEILLQGGSLRFSQIACSVTDLSDRMLSDRLKELEAHGLVERTVFPGPPVRVEYALTHKGQELAPALAELKRWARHWLASGLFESAGSQPRVDATATSSRSADSTPSRAHAPTSS
jgi:DNA-binding HxlR family transcriptional regulator